MDSELKFVVHSGHPVKTSQTPGKLLKCPAGREGVGSRARGPPACREETGEEGGILRDSFPQE